MDRLISSNFTFSRKLFNLCVSLFRISSLSISVRILCGLLLRGLRCPTYIRKMKYDGGNSIKSLDMKSKKKYFFLRHMVDFIWFFQVEWIAFWSAIKLYKIECLQKLYWFRWCTIKIFIAVLKFFAFYWLKNAGKRKVAGRAFLLLNAWGRALIQIFKIQRIFREIFSRNFLQKILRSIHHSKLPGKHFSTHIEAISSEIVFPLM